ncbi:MAG: DUF177 domain-containing protein [Chloroflexota bacterium]|nr:DUF177 domain-containing protein [Chloroflexota bacterium]
MQYNVAQLLKESTGAVRWVAVAGELAMPGGASAWYDGGMELLRTHQGLLVRGTVAATAPSGCSRCLNEFASRCQIEVEEEFFPVVDVNTGRRMEPPWDYDGTTIDESHVLDISEVLRQCTIAAQPIKPLCNEECQGLCQECGVDLNESKCMCSGGDIDPRWEALAALLNQPEN